MKRVCVCVCVYLFRDIGGGWMRASSTDLTESVSSGLAAERRDNVRFKVTDVSTLSRRLPP